MRLRRKKSKKQQAADLLGTYLKAKAASKAAKGATEAVKRTPVKRVPLFLAGAAAAVFVALKVRGGRDEAATA
jgi:hypothetical protein